MERDKRYGNEWLSEPWACYPKNLVCGYQAQLSKKLICPKPSNLALLSWSSLYHHYQTTFLATTEVLRSPHGFAYNLNNYAYCL